MNETANDLKIEEVYAYLRVRDASAAIDFYARAFGAVELYRLTEPSGRVGHAELRFGPTTIMLSEAFPESGIVPPRDGQPISVSIHLHVSDVDAAFARALAAGATVARPLQDHFYGERGGAVHDPFGHEWLLGGKLEDVEPAEMQRRYTALFD